MNLGSVGQTFLSAGSGDFPVRARIESGGGPPHSKTLARRRESLELPTGFGVRRPCGALEFSGRFTIPILWRLP